MNQVAEKMFREEEDRRKKLQKLDKQNHKKKLKRKALVVPKLVRVAIDPGCGEDVSLGGRRVKKVARMRPSLFQPNVRPKS